MNCRIRLAWMEPGWIDTTTLNLTMNIPNLSGVALEVCEQFSLVLKKECNTKFILFFA